MFAKLSTVLALFAVAAQVAVAIPPACLIAAVNTQSDPSDRKSVCTSGATEVQKYMSSNCGDNLDTAQSAFADVCKDAGVTISQSSSTSSSSSTHTSKGSSSETSGTHTKSGSVSTATLSNGANTLITVTGSATKTTNGAQQTATSSSSDSDSSSGSGSGSGSASGTPTPSQTGLAATHTGGSSRLGMDIIGLVAVGAFGAMMAM